MLVCLVAGLAAAVQAQATINLNTPVSTDQLVLYAYEIDFSTATGPLRVEFSGSTTGGEARVTLIDTDGPFFGNLDPWDGQSGTVFDVGVDAPNYTGVHMFVVSVVTRTGTASTNVTGTLSVPGLPGGAISFMDSVVLFEERLELHSAFERAVMLLREYAQPGVRTYRFDVDYGPTAQSAEISLRVLGEGLNNVRLFEVSAAGSRTQIEQFDADIMGEIDEWDVTQTSARSGLVTFEMDVDVAVAGGDVDWLVIPSNNVAVVPITIKRQNFNTIVTDGVERLHRFRVDYGPTPREATIKLSVSRVAGNSAVEVSLIDLDTTTETAVFTTDDVLVNTSGGFSAELVTAEHTGVREFVVALKHSNPSITATTALEGNLRAILPDLGGVTAAGTQDYNAEADGPVIAFERAALLYETGLAARAHRHAVRADFGSGPARDFSIFLGGQNVQSMTVHMIQGSAVTTLFSQSGGAGNTIGTSALLTAPAGVGQVTLRVESQTLANAEIEWVLFVPAAVTLSPAPQSTPQPAPGSTGSGCLMREGTGTQGLTLLLLLGALALICKRSVRFAQKRG